MVPLQFLFNTQNYKAKNNIELSYSVFKLGNLFIYVFVFLGKSLNTQFVKICKMHLSFVLGKLHLYSLK